MTIHRRRTHTKRVICSIRPKTRLAKLIRFKKEESRVTKKASTSVSVQTKRERENLTRRATTKQSKG